MLLGATDYSIKEISGMVSRQGRTINEATVRSVNKRFGFRTKEEADKIGRMDKANRARAKKVLEIETHLGKQKTEKLKRMLRGTEFSIAEIMKEFGLTRDLVNLVNGWYRLRVNVITIGKKAQQRDKTNMTDNQIKILIREKALIGGKQDFAYSKQDIIELAGTSPNRVNKLSVGIRTRADTARVGTRRSNERKLLGNKKSLQRLLGLLEKNDTLNAGTKKSLRTRLEAELKTAK
ncbi:MAG: hypothetical protein CL944_01830 [Candidatus Diapherotrites archaeon]|uniref:Uncharacterized protein n=1 Tax=Candidatus Iainarchaeum sp. TaxID=3101447 RepID=A0A2D6LPS6_9ARCH|nr:hypothetical protein [Candidatus Diapherotrites archaeon]